MSAVLFIYATWCITVYITDCFQGLVDQPQKKLTLEIYILMWCSCDNFAHLSKAILWDIQLFFPMKNKLLEWLAL